ITGRGGPAPAELVSGRRVSVRAGTLGRRHRPTSVRTGYRDEVERVRPSSGTDVVVLSDYWGS
ncbi:hypothetical protein ACFQE1_17530, partial [Halobium palmae]